MRLSDCFYLFLFALAARQSELMLPMFYFSCLLENQNLTHELQNLPIRVFVLVSLLISSHARTVLTRFCETRCLACRVSLLVFCCCLCSFVIHAQIEKCSQVIHDDRRTGSRAVLLCLPTLEKRCVIFPHLVLRHASCRAGFSFGVVFLTPGYRTDPAWQILPRTSLCPRTLSRANRSSCLVRALGAVRSSLVSSRTQCEVLA